MEKRSRENLTELFGLFLGRQDAQSAWQEVRDGEQLLELHPAPLPAAGTVDQIKRRMQLASQHRRRVRRFVQGAAAVAAAIMIVAGLSQHDLHRTRNAIGFASLIPAALWESDDVASDDVQLAYFNSEVDRLEAQIQAIEKGDADTTGTGTLNEVETELFRIDTDFWKG